MFFGKLLPREGNFFELFNQHAARIVEAAHAFSGLVANYSDLEKREAYNREVDNAERAADRITHEVNRLLHKTFITPIDREQIHDLINAMDDILDLLQDSAYGLIDYPPKYLGKSSVFAAYAVHGCVTLNTAESDLDSDALQRMLSPQPA